MSAAAAGGVAAGARDARRARLKLLTTMALTAWARAVVVIVGAGVAPSLVGLGAAAGFAVIPGIYLALGPPVGPLGVRVRTVLGATLLVVVAIALGAVLSGSTLTVTAGLVAVAFAAGLLPRLGPRWAALQLPVLTAFAYSAAFPLAEVSLAARVGAVLAATPVYLLAAALLFQTDARRPLLLGAAAAFGGVADALEHAVAGVEGAAREAERGLVAFRVATGRLKDAALPSGASQDSRAGRLLAVAAQQAVAGAELLASAAGRLDGAQRERAATLAVAARRLAAGLHQAGPVPAPGPLAALAVTARGDGDAAATLLADALADGSVATAVLRGEATELPESHLLALPGPLARLRGVLSPDDPTFRRAVRLAVAAGLAGCIASLLGLTRIYWAVFAAVVVLSAPAARDWRRALWRIAGTAAGLVAALVLVALVGDNGRLAFLLALVALLPAVFLMPINYGAAVFFITCTVSLMYTVSGEESDFLRFRVVDNAVGVAVVCGVGLLLWHTSRDDWWRCAGRAATALAAAVVDPVAGRHRDTLVTRSLQLRTETVEAAALPARGAAFAAAWTFVAAAEDLVRAILLPEDGAPPPAVRSALAARLQAIAARCLDGVPAGGAPPGAPQAPPPGPAAPSGSPPAPSETRAELDVARMATAVDLLQRPGSGA
jgi:uncharacterized membrane protein YccC